MTDVPRREDCGRRLAPALMVLSGFAALGYQIVWTQQCVLWLGHESAAVLAVVAAFFGGLAVGAWALGARIERSIRPARWYAVCEIGIAIWAVALALLLAPISDGLLELIGAQPSPLHHWVVAFFGTFILLLPATAAMGATLPAMARMLASVQERGSPIAVLYACNTAGAVLGVLATAFWLVPMLGLMLTAGLCAALNLICAVVALNVFPSVAREADAARCDGDSGLHVLAVTGLLGIGYEVLVVRALSQVAENTVYTFANLLAVYLVGSALGAAAYGRWLPQLPSDPLVVRRVRDRLLQLLALACALGVVALAGAQSAKPWLLVRLGGGMSGALASEALLAASAFLLPTIVMGALFSHLSTTARAAGIGFGRALGANTMGAALAPVLFGVVLVPLLGLKLSLLIIVAGYLMLVSMRAWRRPLQWVAVGAGVVLSVSVSSLTAVDLPPGGHLVRLIEGVMASVSIVEDADGVTSMHINNRQQEGSSATVFADARQALLPIQLHPHAREVLFLGLGTGVTASVAAEDPTRKVVAVELLPEVIEASAQFRQATATALAGARVQMLAADARRFVRVTDSRYDVIISDNFHPARSGSGSLYTVEHFAAVKGRLAVGGLFCQWLPLHQLDLDTLRSIVRSFLQVYPRGAAMLATNSLDTPVLGLVASGDDARIDVASARTHLTIASQPDPRQYGIADDLALFGSLVGGPNALARFAGDAPLNTDDRPVVIYRAPRITYDPDSRPRDRLVAFLDAMSIEPDEVLVAAEPEWMARLASYWRARNRFIEVGLTVRPSADVRRMLAQVGAPLFGVLHMSPDFRPAYDPLLQMGRALSNSDVAAASALFAELERAQPARPEAGQALSHLARVLDERGEGLGYGAGQ